jgi:pyridine nucleotide-disulfide oxidoreductase family protein
MPRDLSPNSTKLVLIGGGHSHAVALAHWRHSQPKHQPIATITLITPNEKTVYSGAVPGYLAGLSDRRACELEVGRLARSFGVNVILDQVVGLDLKKQLVICQNHEPIAFDIASLNIGSTPRLPLGTIASRRIIPMKPMGQMLDRLEQFLEQRLAKGFEPQTPNPLSLAIVGGGLGGIEVALSLKARWGNALDLAIVSRGSIAGAQPKALQQFLLAELQRRSIAIHSHTTVEAAIETTAETSLLLKLSSGKPLRCEVSLWATEATAPDWLRSSGLATDDRGFVLVDGTLRSVSHDQIFASGDINSLQSSPVPKAGVFAVRQGQILSQNLSHSLSRQPLARLQARSTYLSLISLGDRRAVASYGQHALYQNHWQSLLWCWKRSIDVRFVDRINLDRINSNRSV